MEANKRTVAPGASLRPRPQARGAQRALYTPLSEEYALSLQLL